MSNGRNSTWVDAMLDSNLATARLALCVTSAPTSTVVPGGLAVGGGYTAGGPLIDVNVAASGVVTGPTVAITLTNSSGVPWNITGVLVHTAGAAHPSASQVLYWNDVSLTVADTLVFTLPIDALTFTETL